VNVEFAVHGRDELDVVELIQDGRVVKRFFAEEAVPDEHAFAKPIQLRLEWGWGPWGALALERVCDWEMEVAVEDGRITRFFPCLQSMPFDERRRHRFDRSGDNGLAIRSYTARQNAYRENPNQSVVLEIDGGASTALQLSLKLPCAQESRHTLGELLQGSVNRFTGQFPKEGWQWHRLVPLAASSLVGQAELEVSGRSHVYLRARQKNGHMAWASPVFVNYR
jgi:hypothetical protein